MKIRAIVQAEHWLNRAGVRIRYRRIAPHMTTLGARIEVGVIDKLDNTLAMDDDVVILSKCNDVRALLAADLLRRRGVVVGLDMFDDYFSPQTSACLSHREFLREMAERVDFFLCSTPRMQAVVKAFAPNKPSHILNDPFDQIDENHLQKRIHEKAQRAIETRRLDVLWFGIGENPVFPVGVSDLSAFAFALKPLMQLNFDVRLKVLTNLGALHSQNLARLRGLGVQIEIEEWTEEGEEAAIDDALLAFIPVNYQNFSTAKSLNRGISALTGGAQLLSAGYDLYSAIGDFRYRDASTFLSDLQSGRLKMRADTLPALFRCLDEIADPLNEPRKLISFLKQFSSQDQTSSSKMVLSRNTGPQAVLFGRRSSAAEFVYCRDRNVLSIGTPFCSSGRKFDLHFDFEDGVGEIEIRVAESGARAISGESHSLLTATRNADPNYPFTMKLPTTPDGDALKALRPYMIDSRAGQMVHYTRNMNAIESIAKVLLKTTRIFRSELQTPLMGLGKTNLGSVADGGSNAA